MPSIRRISTLALLAGLIVGCLAEAASAAFPGRNGRIAFTVETTDSTGEIAGNLLYVIDPDGSDRQRVSANGGNAAFSPRGRFIVYARQFGNNDGLRLRRSDGLGRVTVLTHGEDYDPDWSPDGRRIVFSRGFSSRRLLIYRRGRTRVLTGGRDPTWSTRGWIAFERSGVIYVIRPNGTRLRDLGQVGSSPDWSPDGRLLAFVDASEYISTVRADGTGLRRLRRGSEPAFSPNGHKLVYAARNGFLMTMGANGEHPRRVPRSFGSERFVLEADWQPLPPR